MNTIWATPDWKMTKPHTMNPVAISKYDVSHILRRSAPTGTNVVWRGRNDMSRRREVCLKLTEKDMGKVVTHPRNPSSITRAGRGGTEMNKEDVAQTDNRMTAPPNPVSPRVK